MMSTEEPPRDKDEKVSLSPLCSLPHELALSCLARVPRSDHAALSQVSKRYRSLVASPELYKIRSLIGRAEKCLYVCICTYSWSDPQWYVLRCGKQLEDAKSRLIPIPSMPVGSSSSIVVLDWGIYVIGSDVLLLDCRTHTWRNVPSMSVDRSYSAAGVIDGKIFMFGGCDPFAVEASTRGEVFDPKTQTWDTLVPLPDTNTPLMWVDSGFVTEEKVYGVHHCYPGPIHSLYYSPREGKWGEHTELNDESYGIGDQFVMIGKMLFCSSDYEEKLFWCEPEVFKWKEVKGLDSLMISISTNKIINHEQGDQLMFDSVEPPFSNLCKFGDNIVVFWRDANSYNADCSGIWCAEISFERRIEEEDEIWGTVEWSDALIKVDQPVPHCASILYSACVDL